VSDDYAKPSRSKNCRQKPALCASKQAPALTSAKESPLAHLDTLADNVFEWMYKPPRLPDIIHTHYADAGYVGVRLSKATGIPLIPPAYSLGVISGGG